MHVIQLRGPWECETTGRAERFDWERDAAVLAAEGPLTLVRRFGRPSGIEPGDRVWLVIAGFASAEVSLNDARVDELRCDVAGLLAARNTLRIVGLRSAEVPQVRLEIEPAAVT